MPFFSKNHLLEKNNKEDLQNNKVQTSPLLSLWIGMHLLFIPLCADIVQSVFSVIWINKKSLDIGINFKTIMDCVIYLLIMNFIILPAQATACIKGLFLQVFSLFSTKSKMASQNYSATPLYYFKLFLNRNGLCLKG